MPTATSIDTGAEHLATWITVVGQRLHRLPEAEPSVLLAHAMSGFLAIGRASMTLLITSANPTDIREHDLVFEITAEAEQRLTDAATERIVNQITDRGEHIQQYLGPAALDAMAKARLRHCAQATAIHTRDLLIGIDDDPAVPGDIGNLARDLATRANLIATVYADDPHQVLAVSSR
ncbi:hypothetical protein [Nocardia sp. CNY236]|uniref:hypothetical protein n=1 Tax=Nocardia sp. CNY236 TaxID=1169152 RepID=UPI00041D0EDA|nr:hypothetical protein [Nocardia sp. CNY236]